MTRRQIDAAREARLWIGQVIVPAVVGAVTINTMNPELFPAAKRKIGAIASNLKFKKKGEQ